MYMAEDRIRVGLMTVWFQPDKLFIEVDPDPEDLHHTAISDHEFKVDGEHFLEVARRYQEWLATHPQEA